tara:strand:- start:223 stop:771 length:549 start_codon:yes stop_codon:yes gene_type:complete
MALTRINNQALLGATGTVLQTKFVRTSNAFDTTITNANEYADVTGLSLSITPISTTSNILLQYHLDQFTNSDADSGYNYNSRILRTVSSTDTAIQATQGNRIGGLSGGWLNFNNASWSAMTVGSSFLDSPSTTSAITYKVQITSTYTSGGNTLYVNRIANQDDDNSNFMRGVSFIQAMEIAG